MEHPIPDLRYPIGKYSFIPFSTVQKDEWISDIRFLPQAVEHAILNLNDKQLHTPYREGGWTVHQLVHHIADSHMNAFCRFKLALTETNPTIKPYEENEWVKIADVSNVPVNVSITLLFSLHQRWHELLISLKDEEWLQRTVYHPQQKKTLSLWDLLTIYSWHGRHHTAHITSLRERMNWK